MRVSPIRSGSLAVTLAAALLVMVASAGCGRPSTMVFGTVSARPATTAATTTTTGTTAGPSTPAPPAVIPASLRFTATTLDGRPFDAATLAGRPVILWFWAPWCAVCFGQGLSVTDVAQQYSGRLSIVGVAGLDQSTKAMQQFVTEAEVGNVVHLNDRTGTVWKKFGIKEQSNFVMINRAGTVMLTGFQDSVTLSQWAAYLVEH